MSWRRLRAGPSGVATLAVATAAALVIALPGRPAAADEGDGVPSGNWGMFLGGRDNMGALGESYGFGLLAGFLAHYHPTRPGRSFSLGIGWSTTLFGRFGADNAMIAETPLWLVEMSAGLRLRRSLGDVSSRFLVLSGGGTILRTNTPIPPEDKRLYLGGYGGLGYEQYLGRLLLSLEARYGLIGPAPQSISVLFGFGWGS